MASKPDRHRRALAQNRKARHEYYIEETLEAGIVLTGTEIKSVRQGRISLQEAYARIQSGEAWLHQCHIQPYEQGNRYNADPVRPRKLLLHKQEIERLAAATQRKGYALIPLDVHLSRGRAKIALGLARGKKLYDKRASIRERDEARSEARAERGRSRF